MVSAEPLHSLSDSDSDSDAGSSDWISLSSEFLDESNFITICPNPRAEREEREAAERGRAARNVDFEFLSAGNLTSSMIAADELFSEGKLLPFWQIHHAEKLKRINLKSDGVDEAMVGIEAKKKKEESRMSTWFVDDDPSPRPPKCTVLWKELLKLKKQRPSTMSPSNCYSSPSPSPSSSSSSSSSSLSSRKEAVRNSEKCSKRMKKGQERVSIRIRPVSNTQVKNAALPPLFSFRRGKLDK